MPRRRLALLAVSACVAACLPSQPSTTAPVESPSATIAPTTAPALVADSLATPTPTASPSATASALPAPEIQADDDVADTDRQELLSLFESSDVQVYLPTDVISDGSGAYFGIEALPAQRPTIKFRRRAPQTLGRQLHLAYLPGTKDRVVATMTLRQRVVWDLLVGTGARDVTGLVRQVRDFQVVREARKWRLEKVGVVRLHPDADAAGVTIRSLSLQADGKPVITVETNSPVADLTGLPTVKAGQELKATVTVAPAADDPAPVLLGLLRAPGLGGGQRLTAEADGTTFSRSLVVPDKPGTYHVGADVVNLTALAATTPRVVFANWAVTLKVK